MENEEKEIGRKKRRKFFSYKMSPIDPGEPDFNPDYPKKKKKKNNNK